MAMATLPCKKYQNCNCKKKQKKDKTWQQIDQTRQGNSLDTLNPIVFLLLRRGRHPVHSVLPLHNLPMRVWKGCFWIFWRLSMKLGSPCHHCPSCRPWSPHSQSRTAQSNVACFGLLHPLSAEEREVWYPFSISMPCGDKNALTEMFSRGIMPLGSLSVVNSK